MGIQWGIFKSLGALSAVCGEGFGLVVGEWLLMVMNSTYRFKGPRVYIRCKRPFIHQVKISLSSPPGCARFCLCVSSLLALVLPLSPCTRLLHQYTKV